MAANADDNKDLKTVKKLETSASATSHIRTIVEISDQYLHDGGGIDGLLLPDFVDVDGGQELVEVFVRDALELSGERHLTVSVPVSFPVSVLVSGFGVARSAAARGMRPTLDFEFKM